MLPGPALAFVFWVMPDDRPRMWFSRWI